jgi:hypothetical protein
MDQHTRNNWKKIKDALEASGKTDSFFYVRACSILSNKVDPLDNALSKERTETKEEST